MICDLDAMLRWFKQIIPKLKKQFIKILLGSMIFIWKPINDEKFSKNIIIN